MAATSALRLVDLEGSVMIVTRIEDLVFIISVQYAGDAPFRMFEEDRAKLREFLKPLVG
jgi:hypothetical protein